MPLLLMSVSFMSCSVTKYSQKAYANAKKEKPFDVVVVPGVPYEGKQTSDVMKMRLFWAKHLYDSGFTKNIIFSGGAVYSSYVESIVMKIMADSLGIPPENTFSETKAEHSTENAYYSWLMAKKMGFQKIALATDPFQAKLLRSLMRRFCPGMKSIPIVMGTLNINDKVLPEIDATAAKVENFVSIVEKEGFFKRFRYTLGKRVKDQARLVRKKEREAHSN
jgi:uncharacterized SAM-binding protein YcdF (DUF218 family)